MDKYSIITYRRLTLLLSLAFSLAAGGKLSAETITLNALDSFSSVEDGAIAYQRNEERGSLFIDTTATGFEGQFARATTSFTGTGGNYEFTLTTLAEAAGQSTYRIMVNGVIAGTASNELTTENFAVQQHTFTDVFVPTGATLSVESNAASNGLVPQDAGFAYASGHWQSLVVQNDAVDATVDLQLSATVTETDLRAGDTFTININAENASDLTTATSPLIAIQLPATIDFAPPAECVLRSASTTLTCELPEIGPQQSAQLSIPAVINATGQISIDVSVNADQSDADITNNQSTVIVDTRDPGNPASVDLNLTVTTTSDTSADTLESGQLVSFTAEVTNAHPTTVATSPEIEIIVPDNLLPQPSDDCIDTGQILLCLLSELAPGQSQTIEFSATAIIDGNSEISVATSANESDVDNSNNTVVLPVSVLSIGAALVQPDQQPAEPVDEGSEGEGGNGGGGSLSLLLLLLLLPARLVARRTPRMR